MCWGCAYSARKIFLPLARPNFCSPKKLRMLDIFNYTVRQGALFICLIAFWWILQANIFSFQPAKYTNIFSGKGHALLQTQPNPLGAPALRAFRASLMALSALQSSDCFLWAPKYFSQVYDYVWNIIDLRPLWPTFFASLSTISRICPSVSAAAFYVWALWGLILDLWPVDRE